VTTDNQPLRVLRAKDSFRFPGGKRIGIVFNIAYEAWSPGKAPGIGPMGNVLQPGYFDTNAHSWASYGAVRGVGRLLRIAGRNAIKTSVMVNGVLAERFPDSVRAIRDGGHEIVAHSYGMDVIPVYFDEAAELANLRRTTALIEAAAQVRPIGWISPRGTGSLATPRLLAAEGYQWHGDCNDDDLPAIWEFAGPGGAGKPVQRIVGIPLTMDVNDLPHSIRYGNGPEQFAATFKATLDGARAADEAPFMLDVTAHTHAYGRPAGAWAWDACIKIAKAAPDVWIGTRAEICALALGASGELFV
jgi:peptidoglycan/xylan/chitin deacetylase (PgdA/CDA1 family)